MHSFLVEIAPGMETLNITYNYLLNTIHKIILYTVQLQGSKLSHVRKSETSKKPLKLVDSLLYGASPHRLANIHISILNWLRF